MVAVAVLGLAGTGVVAQGVSFSGSAGMGVKYSGNTENAAGETTMESTIKWVSDFDVAMSASGTTDGGLTFGGAATIKASNGDSAVGNSNVYIGGESWKIAIGDLDPASDKGKPLGDIGYDGIGVDDVAEQIGGNQGTIADVEVSFSLGAASLAITAGQKAGGMKTAAMYEHLATGVIVSKDRLADTEFNTTTDDPDDLTDDSTYKLIMAKDATKQDTEWAAGVGFDIGSTSLGIGMDSEKLYQVSVGADLGAFAGTLYYSQQKVDGPTDLGTDNAAGGAGIAADKARKDNKLTGIGVSLSVSAGTNTTINAMYTQGKQSDTRGTVTYADPDDESSTTQADFKPDAAKSKTDKGFGVGVSHGLGGGATLEAGFGKVKKQTVASVGVTMSF